MKSQIKIGSELTIKRCATITDNVTVKSDLNLINIQSRRGVYWIQYSL